jgi:peptidoglycan/LPS O-acetylase OafA/YrhL
MTSSNAGPGDLDRGFWDWAIKRAPRPARFLLGGYLLLAVAGLVFAWRISLRSLILTAVVVLLCSVVVALLVSALQRRIRGPATFLLWAIVVLIVAVFALFVLCAFSGWPPAGAILVARMMNLPELVMRDGTPESVTTGNWPDSTGVASLVRTDFRSG